MKAFSLKSLSVAIFISGILLTGCDSNEPDVEPNEQELITRVVISVADGVTTQTITASDPEGDGQGLTFSPAVLSLSPGTYQATLTIFNDVAGETINEEIEEEAGAHLFRYSPEGSVAGRMNVTITDMESDYAAGDANPGRDIPVGLAFSLTVSEGDEASGNLNVTLFHFEDTNLKTSGSSQSSERDIDIDFPISITAE